MKFTELLAKTKKDLFKGKLLALDPGETTGWCTLRLETTTTTTTAPGPAIVRPHYALGQLATNPIEQATPLLTKLFEEQKPDHIVYEDYKVYNWKAQSHSWNELHTPQLIGTIRTLASQMGIPVSTEMAQQPKQFVTDEKLKEWGIYHRGLKHARDAQRHAVYWLLFRNSQVQKS